MVLAPLTECLKSMLQESEFGLCVGLVSLGLSESDFLTMAAEMRKEEGKRRGGRDRLDIKLGDRRLI